MGNTLVVDIEWDDYFQFYFQDSPYGNLTAVIVSRAPTDCTMAHPVVVTIHATDRKARVVVPVLPEYLGCATAPNALFFMARIVWVSCAARRRRHPLDVLMAKGERRSALLPSELLQSAGSGGRVCVPALCVAAQVASCSMSRH